MNRKMRCIILLIGVLSLLVGTASAKESSLTTLFEIRFGDEVYVNEFEITWEEDEEGGTETTVTIPNSYGRVIANSVNLYSNPSVTSDVIAFLPNGTLLRITSKYEKTDGEIWYKVSVKNGAYTCNGYIRSDLMEKITEAQYNAAGGNSGDNYSDYEILGMIRITADEADLRYSPNNSFNVVGQAKKGDVFSYVNTTSGWFLTQEGYWVSAYDAKVMTSSEVKDYNDSIVIENDSKTYRNGSTGIVVREIQVMLNTLGYYDGKISGNFGNLTEEAVRVFQRDNGFGANGVATPETIKAIRAAYMKLFESDDSLGSEFVYNDVIYNLSYTKNSPEKTGRMVMVNLGLKSRAIVKLTDVQTGLSFNIDIQSVGSTSHVDAEPRTAADTATMCKIYGVSTAAQIPYKRRAMILTVGGEQFLCSVYGEPHGMANITNNNFTDASGRNGQFCIHFKDSVTNAGDGGNVPDSQGHQAIIAAAAKELNGKEINDKVITVSDSFVTYQIK